jgi:hypothetical protein
MGDSANQNGNDEAKWFSKNDIAARAAEIVIRSLGADDKLTFITYDSYVNTIVKKMSMTPDNQTNVINSVKRIVPSGCTALWDGLLQGFVPTEDDASIDHTVILITDGQPNPSPAVGEIEALREYRKRTGNMTRLHTIGIGYDVNSKLLATLATIGNAHGNFLFIPDGTMVITNFVNLMANERCIIGKNVTISINSPDISILSVYPKTVTHEGTTIHLGTLEYGQSRDLAFIIKDGANVTDYNWSASYIATDTRKITTLKPAFMHPDDDSARPDILTEHTRCRGIKALENVLQIGNITLDKACDNLSVMVLTADDATAPIIEDITGEVGKALANRDTWTRWGAPYIMSLMSAHVNQTCTNFKDPGIQCYGGLKFREEKNKLNDMANDLPVPTPSLAPNTGTNNYQPPVVSSQTFVRNYNNASGGCFGDDGNVLMNDGSVKRVKDIVKGDVLDGGATVMCTITFADVVNLLVPVNDTTTLSITPWHPILVNGVWTFPNTLAGTITNTQPLVYNFILDSKHIVTINGVQACTLAHGFEGPVISHDFYGTNRVKDDLMKFPAWESGRIDLTSKNVLVDIETTCVTAYVVA